MFTANTTNSPYLTVIQTTCFNIIYISYKIRFHTNNVLRKFPLKTFLRCSPDGNIQIGFTHVKYRELVVLTLNYYKYNNVYAHNRELYPKNIANFSLKEHISTQTSWAHAQRLTRHLVKLGISK